MTRVLLTGATTPLGVSLIHGLLACADVEQVVAVARPDEASPVGTTDNRFRYVGTDISRSRNLRNLLYREARDVNVVVHAASHRSARLTGARVHRLNVEATTTLLALAEEHPRIERFVYRSFGAVYRVDGTQPTIIDEYHPLDLSPNASQWIRDRVEADLTVCTRTGLSPLKIAVLRFAECVAPRMGSQLHDYLSAPVCFTPWGFDPMLNVISMPDMVRALVGAATRSAEGIFNIPGRDTLPLSEAVRLSGKRAIPVLGSFLSPLYRARTLLRGGDFRYEMNHRRFHWSGVLCGRRAERELGYTPSRTAFERRDPLRDDRRPIAVDEARGHGRHALVAGGAHALEDA